MNTDFIKGIIPPIVTPIRADEKLDEGVLRDHIDYMIARGISGILAFGSNGEFYMLEEDEMESILKVIMDQVKDRLPVYMGVGAVRTSKCIRLARLGLRLGARGVSVLQPMFIKPTEDELSSHFAAIARAVPDTPVLLYNNPGRTGYAISQAVVEELARRVPNIVGMKDSSGDLTETMEFIRRNRDLGFKVLVGKDTLIYPGLEVGAVGAVCSTANYMPELVCSVYELFMAGKKKEALEAQYRLNPVRLMTDGSSFPVAAKDCANLRGLGLGDPYLPNKPSPPAQMENLRRELTQAGLLETIPLA
ncbi:MAG: dihydrodipicolinate synthase family protein [Treponema sp.]|jgi:4-hydroxy-tetrahydrodipicolinate synthase|nr:dihydrodipicolinate synthase family protein [Treponema sp.]